MPPLLGCIILFLVQVKGERILNFKEASSKGVLWASILMTAAATQLGSVLTNDAIGIKVWLSDMLSPIANGLPVIGLILFFIAWAVIETNFSSNIVTTTVVSAVALSVDVYKRQMQGIRQNPVIQFAGIADEIRVGQPFFFRHEKICVAADPVGQISPSIFGDGQPVDQLLPGAGVMSGRGIRRNPDPFFGPYGHEEFLQCIPP